MLAHGGVIGAAGASSASSVNSFSDGFAADTIADWTNVQAGLQWAISGGTLNVTLSSGTDVSGMRVYNKTACGSATQYIKYKLAAVGVNGVSGIVLRSGITTGYCYRLSGPYSGTMYWERISYNGTGGNDVASQAITLAAGDTLAVTVQGTGTSTVLKIWKNATNSAPYNKDNWDSSSDPADYTLTDTGNVLATNPANSGGYVGLASYLPGSGHSVTLDDFFGGGL